jgi:hypothetical protein
MDFPTLHFFPGLFTASHIFKDISSSFQKLLFEHILSITTKNSVARDGAARSRIIWWSRNAKRLWLRRVQLRQLIFGSSSESSGTEGSGSNGSDVSSSIYDSSGSDVFRSRSFRFIVVEPNHRRGAAIRCGSDSGSDVFGSDGLAPALAPKVPAPTAVRRSRSRKAPSHCDWATARCGSGSSPDVFGSDGLAPAPAQASRAPALTAPAAVLWSRSHKEPNHFGPTSTAVPFRPWLQLLWCHWLRRLRRQQQWCKSFSGAAMQRGSNSGSGSNVMFNINSELSKMACTAPVSYFSYAHLWFSESEVSLYLMLRILTGSDFWKLPEPDPVPTPVPDLK